MFRNSCANDQDACARHQYKATGGAEDPHREKEPKILYSGACEQPANTSGAARDKAASGQGEAGRGPSRSVDSIFIFSKPHPSIQPQSYRQNLLDESIDQYLGITFAIDQYVGPIDSSHVFLP